MRILAQPRLSQHEPCPYLADEMFQQEYFVGTELDRSEFQSYLDQRWRRFGIVFFRPVCPSCRKCRPIRVLARSFLPTKSQKRVLNKNRDTKVIFSPLNFKEEFFRIYEKHSLQKFGQESSREEFIRNFYNPGVPSFQSEYYIDGVPAGFGILDVSSNGLSSVYFCYDPDFSEYSLGSFSVIEEIKQTVSLDLEYYYLGYYIEEAPRMAYKGRFHPHEILVDGVWTPSEMLKKSVGTTQEVNIEQEQ
ncbi:arginyltransferase [Oceanispirochaeta crateris]|uniref:Arginyltransferase n=1 Tax=Oceanispirochaeta crateris TaxID=2518645 RepID=A0A5C1QQJ6_9SPIO|nr:arginyltransferase [Oceanispirochaeta crateris]QEN09240.1 arginyltransferase [Oceanispirochaeta crateris]